MYAKITNEETKQCAVGIGTNIEFYKSIGMEEMEVEKAYDNTWYIKGYAPVKPLSMQYEERIVELQKLLSSWDYKTSKYIDGDYSEEEWKEIVSQRESWRLEIRELEDKLKEWKDGTTNIIV